MKAHTNDYKTAISMAGRRIKSQISYTINEEEIILTDDELYSINYNYKSSILKSVMKQLEFTSKNDIPLNTILKGEFSLLVNGDWETINFGNYVVYKSEKQEDMNSYKITCYDKMLYSMIEYNNETKLNITYPISIRDYINAICNKLGLTFKNANNTFANYNKQIQNELYLDASNNSLGYTYRDILDELAQVTASTICIDEATDSLEVRYINNTNDTIDGDYLKNINVNFGEKYGPVNSIVLSRSAGADNVFLRDEQSVTQNGLCEIKISDNQIMNFNDRSDYLPDILNILDGLEYYLNDFASTGITYYNLCDKYNVEIDDTTYSCIMFNDEINITQGLEEKVYTEMSESAETDYTKADKTDRRINQTYFIVDKQNQVIEGLVSNVSEQNTKIAQIQVSVDEINQKIGDVTDITVTAEDTDGQVELEGVNESEPIQIKIRPIGINISYDYPHNDYPQNDYSSIRTLRFTRSYVEEGVRKTQIIDYELPYDLLYYDQDNYDEFYLDYDTATCQVTKRCVYNSDGTVGLLSTPQVIDIDPYPTISLGDGDYTVCLLGYNQAYLFVRLMASNIYTTQFATKVELQSEIRQTKDYVDISASQKVGKDEVINRINVSLEGVLIQANKINIQGVLQAVNNDTTTTINGNKITTGTITADQIATGAITADQIATGAITASKVSSDIITTTNFSAQNINADKITAGSMSMSRISGGTLNVGAGRGYLRVGVGYTHPEVSGLNVGNYGISMNNSSIGGCYNIGTQYLSASGSDGIVKCNTIFRAETLYYKGDDNQYHDVNGLYRWFQGGASDYIDIRDAGGTKLRLHFNYGLYNGYTRI